MAETTVIAPVEPAAPAAPVEPAAPSNPQGNTPEERHAWRLKGPQGPPKETPVDPAAPVESKAKPKHDKLTAEQREQQLDTAIEERRSRIREKASIKSELDRQLAERGVPEPKPAPVESKKSLWDRLKTLPDAPKLDAFENYEDFSAAQAEFIADKRYEERRAQEIEATRQSRAEQARTARLTQFQERYKTADAETLAVIDAADLMVPDDPGHPITYAITDSPIPADLMRYVVEHPDEYGKILSMPDPNAQYVAMQRIEARLQALQPAPPASRNADSRPAPSRVADSRPASPAPEEPVTLGRKPGSPVDELKAAWERGDTRTARRLQLERDRGSVTTR